MYVLINVDIVAVATNKFAFGKQRSVKNTLYMFFFMETVKVQRASAE